MRRLCVCVCVSNNIPTSARGARSCLGGGVFASMALRHFVWRRLRPPAVSVAPLLWFQSHFYARCTSVVPRARARFLRSANPIIGRLSLTLCAHSATSAGGRFCVIDSATKPRAPRVVSIVIIRLMGGGGHPGFCARVGAEILPIASRLCVRRGCRRGPL